MHFRLFFLGLIVFFSFYAMGQDSLKKTNPVIYIDAGFSLPVSGIGGIQFNSSLNYQYKKNLFTVRMAAAQAFRIEEAVLSPVTVIPYFSNGGSFLEWSVLYGWRVVLKGNQSFSISAGASYNDRVFISYTDKNKPQQEYRYAGLPFEMNILWFKSTKSRYRIYGIFPVGKPTGFGESIGFKLAGNVSQHGYVSLGIVMGMGYFKKY